MNLMALFFYALKHLRKAAFASLAGLVVCMLPWWLRNLWSLGKVSDSTLMINGLLNRSSPGFK